MSTIQNQQSSSAEFRQALETFVGTVAFFEELPDPFVLLNDAGCAYVDIRKWFYLGKHEKASAAAFEVIAKLAGFMLALRREKKGGDK